MLISLPFLLLAPLFALSAPVPTPALAKRYYPWNPVTWTAALRTVQADTTYTLSWKGGSGSGYEVYYIPQWEGQEEYTPVDIGSTSTTSVKWHTPAMDAYPAGTTLVLGIRDQTQGQGAVWFDLTGMIPFVAS